MLVYKQKDANIHDGVIIPAIWEDNVLIFANNGISEKFFGASPESFEMFRREDFVPYAETNVPRTRPFFIKVPDGAIEDDSQFWDIWEYYYVFNKKSPTGKLRKKDIMYTCLTPCKPGTRFCKCDDCGSNFVITPAEARFYEEHDLRIPDIRCPKCIQKRRIQKRGK